jgi:hypothetical protein
LPSFASILRWPELSQRAYLLDPCAGEGDAIRALRDLWAASAERSLSNNRLLSIEACELEAGRAAALRFACDYQDTAHHADAFCLFPEMARETGATVLYLNPPYDQDREFRRLEHRFLLRFTSHLHPGAGFLLYLVPHYALEASAGFLSQNYLDLRCWRLPEPEYAKFRQVLIVGRRSRKPLAPNRLEETILRWAREPLSLPILPERCLDPFCVDPQPDPPYDLAFGVEPLDFTPSLQAFRPWAGTPTGVAQSVGELLGSRFETAMPPRPAHIAMALSSGMFNGQRLVPNDPTLHPPILAKGCFERELVEVSRRSDADGKLTSVVEIERPRLKLTILRLDTLTFHTLEPGTVPTGAADPPAWNAADLIGLYDQSLLGLLTRQFPALHDPRRPEDQIALPGLGRRPFTIQAQAAQAGLKLLAQSRNPFIVAEVGTGKSQMALTIGAALSPTQHATTVSELRRLGLGARLPVVRKILIVCPPHLLDSWTDQAAAVVPEARVQIVRAADDLKRSAQIYILSRETAKLGHGYLGVLDRCPGCGSWLDSSSNANASRRLRCKAQRRRPADVLARLAVALAVLLLPALPDDPLVDSLVSAPFLRRRLDSKPRPLALDALRSFLETLLFEVEGRLFGRGNASSTYDALICSIVPLALALDATKHAADRLRSWVDRAPEDVAESLKRILGRLEPAFSPPSGSQDESGRVARLKRGLESLHSAGTWIELPPCGEPLYQASPSPRRFPLAQHILRRHRRDFDLVILDEAHEYNHANSAQARAAHRLSGLPGVPTIVLSGSLMGGYASSLFPNFWALSRSFRDEFKRQELTAFVDRYGYRRLLTSYDESPQKARARGSHTDREFGTPKPIGEAPGVMPTFLMKHLLPTAIFVHKGDLDSELPSLCELPTPVELSTHESMQHALLSEYSRLKRRLLACIGKDRFTPDRSGRLLGALVELPSYLDRATDDLEPFVLCYPDHLGGEIIATGQQFPSDWRTPKEAALLTEVRAFLERGQRVIIFLRHTGTKLPLRLLRLLRTVTDKVAWLDAKKVPTDRRETWINQHVIEPGVEVLVVNPNAVRTGLNNLVAFSAAVWYELDTSATTYRQANGRLHRIGQTKPVTIRVLFYRNTTQELTFDLVARKVSASLQVDGLDLQTALEAAGASESHSAALAAAMSLGQALYASLTG